MVVIMLDPSRNIKFPVPARVNVPVNLNVAVRVMEALTAGVFEDVARETDDCAAGVVLDSMTIKSDVLGPLFESPA